MNSLRIAALMSAILALAKGGAFMWSGSIVVLASFLDSLVDTFLSFLNFKISKWSQEQPDSEHPYGHGGFEVMTSMMQGMLIAGSGVMVYFRLSTGSLLRKVSRIFPLIAYRWPLGSWWFLLCLRW